MKDTQSFQRSRETLQSIIHDLCDELKTSWDKAQQRHGEVQTMIRQERICSGDASEALTCESVGDSWAIPVVATEPGTSWIRADPPGNTTLGNRPETPHAWSSPPANCAAHVMKPSFHEPTAPTNADVVLPLNHSPNAPANADAPSLRVAGKANTTPNINGHLRHCASAAWENTQSTPGSTEPPMIIKPYPKRSVTTRVGKNLKSSKTAYNMCMVDRKTVSPLTAEMSEDSDSRGLKTPTVKDNLGLEKTVTFQWDRNEVEGNVYLARIASAVGVEKIYSGTFQDWRDEQVSHGRERRFWKMVQGSQFQGFCSLIILINAAYIGVGAEAALVSAMEGIPVDVEWLYIEILFCIWFGVELLIRLVAERLLFFIGPEYKWNLLDTCLVLFAAVELILSQYSSVTGPNVTAVRSVRFVRVLRLARTVRVFHNFRLVVYAILESMSSMFWCFLVVGFIIYMFSIFFLNAVTSFYEDHAEVARIEHEKEEALKAYWGSIPRAMVTLFMSISGGMDWADCMDPLRVLSWWYEPIFIIYVFFMYLGVLNVVVGAFVATTAEISQKDREAFVIKEMARFEQYAQKVKVFFMEADEDRSGKVSWEEFRKHLQCTKVKAFFQALELDVSQARALFKLLDTDESNEVSLDEFLDGCMRLKGQARSIDVNMLMYKTEKVYSFVQDNIERIQQRLETVSPQSMMRTTSRDTPTSNLQPQASGNSVDRFGIGFDNPDEHTRDIERKFSSTVLKC